MRTVANGLQAEEIRALVGDSPLMLEIGSHEGTDTVKFLKAMPGIQLFCFDPEQRAIARFKQAIGDDPRVTLCEKAVADVDGKLPFYPSTGEVGGREDWDFSGSLCKPTGHLTYAPAVEFKRPISVPCIRLDSWATTILPTGTMIDFAWVDIQGAQRQFIAGATAVLATLDYLYIEAHNAPKHGRLYEGETTQEELIGLLPGFEPLAIYHRDNILFRNRVRDIEAKWERNSRLRPEVFRFLTEKMDLRYMVETGTLSGCTSGLAARYFERVWTIELSPQYQRIATQDLSHHPNVTSLPGDSAEVLPGICKQLDKPTFFWLDAHWSGEGTAKGSSECPLLAELKAIGGLRTADVIFIDDARMFLSRPPEEHAAAEWPRYNIIRQIVATWPGPIHIGLIDDVIVITKNPLTPWGQE